MVFYFSFFFDTSPNFKGLCQEIQITWTLLLDIMGQVAQTTQTLLYHLYCNLSYSIFNMEKPLLKSEYWISLG
jgi:hypothetical protein